MNTQQPATSTFRTAAIAAALTLLFYGSAPFAPGISDFVRRYFCGHPLGFVSTGMFFTGIAVLLQKAMRLRRDRAAMIGWEEGTTNGALKDADPENATDAVTIWLQEQPSNTHYSHLHNRIIDSLHYLKTKGAAGFEDHLRYLAEVASDRGQQSFATIRTITWAIPILGFLGTVIGITMAIANVTPDQLDTSLGEVTGGLSVAFDTTALALAMSIGLVFLSFAVERSEQETLNRIEHFGVQSLLPLFGGEVVSTTNATAGPHLDTAALTNQVTQLQDMYTKVLSEHAEQLSSVLNQEVHRTLKLHRMDAEDTRTAYSNSLQQTAEQVVAQTDRVLASFTERIDAWQDAILTSSQASVAQSESLHDLGRVLLRLTESEERLAQLQEQLNGNLQSIQLANTLEESANSLTAAVSLLSAKTNTRRAA